MSYEPLRFEAAEQMRRDRQKAYRWRKSARQRVTEGPTRGLQTPFVGVDGEGSGTDAQGRQHYKLMRAGDAELYRDDRPLRTADCFDFLCALPRGPIYVGFAIGYDVTQILRDVEKPYLDKLFATQRERDAAGHGRYTYWRDYALEYIPRQFFRVARVDADNQLIPHSSRTIWETFGFFQCSFLKALKQFKIGRPEIIDAIEAGKAGRAEFDSMTADVREYCRLECELLAELMTVFREVCYGADIKPKTWNGAGKLAAALHRREHTPKRDELAVPTAVMNAARDAYYGGRFEVTQIGEIAGPIYEYDIRSAYPAAMDGLPCLLHGRWEETDAFNPTDIAVHQVAFGHSGGGQSNLCGLPIRTRQRRLLWPRQGNGTYWSAELSAARKLGCDYRVNSAWRYVSDCACRPFAWVRALYDYRRSIGSSAAGYPIKLGLNSLYGQLARHVGGGGPWQNYIWAGLITATTRARLMQAAASAPESVVMLATDGIYSTAPLDVSEGSELGQWEAKQHPRMFVVQPGLYWGPPQPKSRGVPRRFFEPLTPTFEQAWSDYLETETAAYSGGLGRLERLPIVSIHVPNFIGLKLAWSRGKPETAGRWITDPTENVRDISFDWSLKRELHSAYRSAGCMMTRPLPGAADLASVSFAAADGDISASVAAELSGLTEGLPDFLDFGPPGFATGETMT